MVTILSKKEKQKRIEESDILIAETERRSKLLPPCYGLDLSNPEHLAAYNAFEAEQELAAFLEETFYKRTNPRHLVFYDGVAWTLPFPSAKFRATRKII